jgi:hypothetical protein
MRSFAGRGAVFAQGNLLARKPVRPFVLAGVGFGEDGGTLVGAGLEVRSPDTRIGFRVTVEDYVARRSGLYGQLPAVHRIGSAGSDPITRRRLWQLQIGQGERVMPRPADLLRNALEAESDAVLAFVVAALRPATGLH